MLNCFVIIYLDDILIYSRSYSRDLEQVPKVLCRLLEYGLYAKAVKCEFHKEEL